VAETARRHKRKTKPKRHRPKVVYVGFVEGKPHFEEFWDTYGHAVAVDVFTSRKDACARYQDVRAMRLVPHSGEVAR
jgi:hypothetical protein